MAIGALLFSLALATSTQGTLSENNSGEQTEQVSCRYIVNSHSFRNSRIKTCETILQWQAYDKMKRDEDRFRMALRASAPRR
ncbi:hypothetical protein [Sphingobium limneticum]|jgi:hypothetical protein|uniref:Uncharacterized protein n=1 Tax=Sphingobium limneticum TaxID=1007511 RepID=A0A5J5I6T0_9SPHN|nr:hypothetical protein [Sphingobium limneticum]KAA9020570.1 hypothetical protein F4U96_02505 [Sphingobium limneticum]KAA9032896.1 hypothetical protein F4U95_02505 [Sphingobium limneticum]